MTRAATAPGSATLASSLYDQLRTDLLEGVLAPGSRLAIEALCERYLTSQTPLREALNRLTVDGLVQRREQRGFAVAPISQADLLEITRTRCWLEEIGLRESIAHGLGDWEERVLLAHHRLQRIPRSLDEARFDDNPEWEPRHRQFHRALLSACGSRWLLGFCDQLADQHYRYRRISASRAFNRRDVGHEHEELMHAALARDTEPAVARLKMHFERTAALVQDNPKLGAGAPPVAPD